MKKTTLILMTILMLAALIVGVSITASAQQGQQREVIAVPDLPVIDRPYNTMEELGLDFAAIDASFPQNVEVRQEGSKLYVKDIGAGSVSIYASNFCDLELVEGYWTADIEGELQFIYFNSFEEYGEDRFWSATYREDGIRDPYVVVNDSAKGVYISFSAEYKNATVQYSSGDYYYEDEYYNGILDTHGVSNLNDTDSVEAIYGANGILWYGKLYTNKYYYYFPGQGWSSTWGSFTAVATPEGYEGIDETYFTANKPSLICSEAEGDDIVHDMFKAYCTTPYTCKNGCGYTTIGEIDYHDWQLVDGKKECSLCDAVFLPEFEFIERTYNNLEESGFPYDEIKAVFPEVLTVKYEDGKYMVKDVGADKAKVYNNVDYEDIEFSLVDGWWICELDEEIYNDESINLFVYFEGEIDGIYWDITYINGTVSSELYLWLINDEPSVSVYYDDDDRIRSTYYVGNRMYSDDYKNGALVSQEVSLYVGDDDVYVAYSADGSFRRAYIYRDHEWYYYYPDGSWERGVEALLDPPVGYEDADVAYFKLLLPTTINCEHESYSEADCESPERCLVCGIDKEGSTALGHDYDDGVITLSPTCMTIGERIFTCRHDSNHYYYEDVPIDENAHMWDDGTVTTNPTCVTEGVKTYICEHNEAHTRTEKVDINPDAHKWDEGTVTTNPTCATEGVKTYICEHNEAHTRTEKVDINPDAHKWDDGVITTTSTCKTPGTKTYTCEHNSEHKRTEQIVLDENAHTDANEDYICDECGAELPKDGLSTGAVVGIVAGSTVVAGTGGFSLFWFVLKKKSWADLIAIFTK